MICLNAYAGEIDSMTYDFDDAGLTAAGSGVRFSVALISSLQSARPGRARLPGVVREVIEESGIPTRLVPYLEAKELLIGRSGSVRLIIDLWSNSRESELRDTAGIAAALLRAAGRDGSVEILACVYPSRPNMKIYSALLDSVETSEMGNHAMTYTPRIAAFSGTSIRSTTGIRASLFSFLSV